jgi:hypothetical protein
VVITVVIDTDIALDIDQAIARDNVMPHKIISIAAKAIRPACRRSLIVPAIEPKAILQANGLIMYLPTKMETFTVRVIKAGSSVLRMAGNLSLAILNRKRPGLKRQVLNRNRHKQVLARNLHGIVLTNHLANHWKRVLRRDSEVRNEAVAPCRQEAVVLVAAGCEAVAAVAGKSINSKSMTG